VGWCAPIRPGRILYEIRGVNIELAKEALIRASYKLPVKTVIVEKEW
ncbi:MAG: ribosomal protein L16, partial [Desulfovibrionales bacterium]|nr:ribosomal protein L16 [Desulfovibrionales bacterium]